MPKIKTKKIAANRFKITKSGKIMHRVQGRRHLRRNKSKSRQRRQDKYREVKTQSYNRDIKRLLGKA